MHRRRDLSPSWSTVRGWFSGDPRVLDAVTALTRHGGIVRVNCAGSEGRLVFRHDRLMQEALSRSLTASIRRGDRPDALFDPFFAETTGQALRRVAVGRELLHEVADHCPLALFEAVRGSGSADEPGISAIIAEATAWSAARQAIGEILPAVLDSIAWSLLSTDSPHATEFVRLLPHHHLLLLAGLRNGSAECGVTYLAGPRHFWAEAWDYQLERSVEVALARHRDRLVGDLTRILRAPELPDARRKGAIELAGYLGTVVSDRAISECYRVRRTRDWSSSQPSGQPCAV